MRRLLSPIGRRKFGCLLGAQLGILAAGANASDQSQLHTVTIKRFKFEPEVLEIKPGDRVEWINEDAAPHTATEQSGDWDTGGLEKSQSTSLTFEEAGHYEYYCAYHAHMKASLRVLA